MLRVEAGDHDRWTPLGDARLALRGANGLEGDSERLPWKGPDVGRPSPMLLARNGDVRIAWLGLVRLMGEADRRNVLAPGTGVTGLVWNALGGIVALP